MSLRYAQLFDGGTVTAPPPGGDLDGYPTVKKIHKFEVTLPNGSSSASFPIGATVDLEKTWAIVHMRTQADHAREAMTGYYFPNNSTIALERYGTNEAVHATVQLVEFEEGVRVQRGMWESPSHWTVEHRDISPVDLDKAFITIKVAAKDDEFDGFDIIGEMWVRAKFGSDADTVRLSHNGNTIGDTPDPVKVYWQVVEFADGARVYTADLEKVGGSNTFRAVDFLDDLGFADPPRLDQLFIAFSTLIAEDSSGTSSWVRFWSIDSFMYNGTAGIWRAGGDVGELKTLTAFFVELEFAYVESHHFEGLSGTAEEQQEIRRPVKGIRDPDNAVAFIPWNQYGGYVAEDSAKSSRLWTTVELEGNDLVVKREDGGAPFVSLEVFLIEFQDPPNTASTGPLVLKEIYSGEVTATNGTDKPREIDVDLPAPVDQEKSIVWATSAGQDAFGDEMAFVDFIDDDTIRVYIGGGDDITQVTWYLIEFESGVRVQRGMLGDADFPNRHAFTEVDPVDPGRAFVITQWRDPDPRASVWLGGVHHIRGVIKDKFGVQTPAVNWQLVEIDNDGEVFHYGKVWENGGDLVHDFKIGSDWDPDSLFVWAIDFRADKGGFQHYNMIPDEDKLVATRLVNNQVGTAAIEIADLGTFEGLVPQREHHFVDFVASDGDTFELALDNVYDVDKTVAWIPLSGSFLVGDAGHEGSGHRLEMIGPSTLHMEREHGVFVNPSDGFEGYVYILGFIPEEESDCPPIACPEGVEVVARLDCDGIEVTESPCAKGVVVVFKKDGGIEICPRGD